MDCYIIYINYWFLKTPVYNPQVKVTIDSPTLFVEVGIGCPARPGHLISAPRELTSRGDVVSFHLHPDLAVLNRLGELNDLIDARAGSC